MIFLMLRTLSVSAALTAALLLVACSTEAPEPAATETATVTVTGPNPTLGSSSTSTDRSTTSRTSTSKVSARSTEAEDTRPVGLTDRQSGIPTPINSTISRCAASSEGLYEQGTTWFTDGTSGWTTHCSERFWNGAPTNTAPTIPATPVQTTQPVPQSTYYANCSAARAAGAAPLYAGQAGYGSHLDGDGDGIACE